MWTKKQKIFLNTLRISEAIVIGIEVIILIIGSLKDNLIWFIVTCSLYGLLLLTEIVFLFIMNKKHKREQGIQCSKAEYLKSRK